MDNPIQMFYVDRSTQSTGIPSTITIEHEFVKPGPLEVAEVKAALAGFSFNYEKSDHHILVEAAYISSVAIVEKNKIQATVTCSFADQSFSEPYNAYIKVLFFVRFA